MRPTTGVPHMDSAALPALLRRAGLERLLPRFEEEDLTVPLLISMGTQLRANLADMALSPDEIEAVAEALLHRADGADPLMSGYACAIFVSRRRWPLLPGSGV